MKSSSRFYCILTSHQVVWADWRKRHANPILMNKWTLGWVGIVWQLIKPEIVSYENTNTTVSKKLIWTLLHEKQGFMTKFCKSAAHVYLQNMAVIDLVRLILNYPSYVYLTSYTKCHLLIGQSKSHANTVFAIWCL